MILGEAREKERERRKWCRMGHSAPFFFFVVNLRMLDYRGPRSSTARIQNLPCSVPGNTLECRGPRLSGRSYTWAWLPVSKFWFCFLPSSSDLQSPSSQGLTYLFTFLYFKLMSIKYPPFELNKNIKKKSKSLRIKIQLLNFSTNFRKLLFS